MEQSLEHLRRILPREREEQVQEGMQDVASVKLQVLKRWKRLELVSVSVSGEMALCLCERSSLEPLEPLDHVDHVGDDGLMMSSGDVSDHRLASDWSWSDGLRRDVVDAYPHPCHLDAFWSLSSLGAVVWILLMPP